MNLDRIIAIVREEMMTLTLQVVVVVFLDLQMLKDQEQVLIQS